MPTTLTITGNESFWGGVKLSPGAIALINKSPTLVSQLLQYGDQVNSHQINAMAVGAGDGTFFDSVRGQIIFASNYQTLIDSIMVGNLAHEIGHFENVSADSSFTVQHQTAIGDPNAYAIDAMIGLHREGEAVDNNYVVQQEIKANGGPLIYLAGELNNGTSTGLQKLLDAQHSYDVASGLSATVDKNLMIEQAMGVYTNLPTSNTQQNYFDYYGSSRGAHAPAPGTVTGASFTDPTGNGNITSVSETFSSGDTATQTFTGNAISASVVSDQFGQIISQTTYSHNADGSYIANIYDGQGHATGQDQFHSDGSEVAYQFNSNGTQNATVLNSAGHETEYATFGTNGAKTQDLFYDATTGHLTQENDFNADGSQTDHIINSDGTQNAIVYNAGGHEIEYATFGTNGVKTQDLFYDATTGHLTRENDFNADGSQTDHIINSDGTQNSVVFNASGHETEYASFNASGVKTQDLFYNATTGQLTQENDFNADGSQIDRVYNTNGTQTATVFNAGGHETEQATFDASGKISKDLVFDGKSGAELQETDYNANGSGVAHIFNPDGTQNAAVFDPSGHISEYATYGTNGKLATDIFYDANGHATQYNEYTSNQTTVNQFNADNTQTATVYNAAGQETEFAKFDTNGHKTDDYFFNGPTGRETQYDSYGSDGSMVEHLFNSDNSQDAIIYDASGRETQYDAFNSQGQLTGFTDFTYTVGGGYDALAYGPTGFETGWADYNGSGSLISSSGGQYNFSLDDSYGEGSGDWDFSAPVYDDGYASDFGFYY
ncbi:hypothetical protein P0D75_23600 [Paraburkholderia sediminicola]|uniref:hypothetical protein n=1 Tax=Paraburkholderia sediminicola TaxID=458836 RepID=UPI0038B90019